MLFTDGLKRELQTKKDSFRDVRQLITAVKEYNNGGNEILWTSYRYDPLKQITDVFDAQNNHTTAEYDLLGRRTVLDNPDTGKVVMDFDLAGNLIHKETPNLRALGETITYRYDYNRLTAIEYPQYPDSNVSYEYGAPNAPNNSANRIVRVTDQGGWETRQYGPLGELTQSTRYLQWSAGPGEQYTTKYTYDTWNRLQQLVYPDGEVLTYDYDVGGQMHAVHGRKGSYDYPYVQRLDYDKFGQRTYVLHGNNTVSRYSYDPNNRRLSHHTVGKGDGNPFMDLSYGYDDVGNITDLANQATNNSPSQMGGATSYTYQYDDLYRLTDSSGTFDTPPGKQHRFTLSLGYDTIHNITHKTQVDVLRQPSGQEVTQKKTTYDWTYRYDGDQPHAPTHLGDRTFTYDANGNQRGWSHDTNGTRRQITWDDENRIREIKDNGHRLTYTYDASGQRLIKRGPQGETGYINQWFTLRNGEVGTKHVYAGTTRVVSKLVKQDKPNSKRKGRIVYEKDQYTYHPDHLGTSAYITHTNGQVYQHLEYFPFGETWVEEHSNKQRTPYLFTAKELDEESQLYYFGARYYDPRTSVWQSADPILSDYLDSERGLGGIYNFKNLGMYSYSHLNPTKYQDPDGNSTVLDNMNYVVSVNQNDGDFSIYRPVAGTGTVLKPGYGGREKIGESAFIDSFVSPDSGNPVGIVYPGQSMDGFMEKLHLEAKMESGPKILGIKSQPGWKYDVKSQFPGHENMSYHGFLFKGKYVSLRDAGNILAGMNAAAHGIPFDDFQKAAGALHSGGKPGLLWHWMTGNTYGTAPNWGEIDYQRTRSEFGYKLIAR